MEGGTVPTMSLLTRLPLGVLEPPYRDKYIQVLYKRLKELLFL